MAQGFRERLEQKAKRSLKELRKIAPQLEKLLDPLNRLLVRMIVDGRPLPESLEVADGVGRKLHAVTESLEQLRHQWGTSADPRAANLCADLLMKDLAAQSQEAKRPSRPRGKPTPQALLRGSSRCVPVATVLELLGTQGKSGTLRVSTQQETFTFEMVRGNIVHASTDHPPTDQLLGNILVERGAVTREALTAFLQRCGDSTDLIGEALERQELVDKNSLRAALEYQVQQRFNRMFAAAESTYYFYEQADAAFDDRLRMNVTQLLLESARSSDEGVRTESPTLPADIWGTPSSLGAPSPSDWNEPHPR